MLTLLLILYEITTLHALGISSSQSPVLKLENSPYRLNSNITIQTNQTLLIEPGVIVLLGPNVLLEIKGCLIANGTENQYIHIKADPSNTSYHQGLYFNDQSKTCGISIVSHVIIEGISNFSTAAIVINSGKNLSIENLKIYNSESGGISIGNNYIGPSYEFLLKNIELINIATYGFKINHFQANFTFLNVNISYCRDGVSIENPIVSSNIKILRLNLENFNVKNASNNGLKLNFGSYHLSIVINKSYFSSCKNGIEIDGSFVNNSYSIVDSYFNENQISLNDLSFLNAQISSSIFLKSKIIGIRKLRGQLILNNSQFEHNNVSVYLVNIESSIIDISTNKFRNDINCSILFDDFINDVHTEIKIRKNHFSKNILRTILFSFKTIKYNSRLNSSLVLVENTFEENSGVSVVNLRFLADLYWISQTHFYNNGMYPTKILIQSNIFNNNQIHSTHNRYLNMKKNGVLDLSFKTIDPWLFRLINTGYAWRMLLNNMIIINNTFNNSKSTFEVTTYGFSSNKSLLTLNLSHNLWRFSNEHHILDVINAHHQSKKQRIHVNIYPCYMQNQFIQEPTELIHDGKYLSYFVKQQVIVNGNYISKFGIFIDSQSNLTIGKNVTITLNKDTDILVLGTLNLNGEVGNEIHFKSISENTIDISQPIFRLVERDNYYWYSQTKSYLIEIFFQSEWLPLCSSSTSSISFNSFCYLFGNEACFVTNWYEYSYEKILNKTRGRYIQDFSFDFHYNGNISEALVTVKNDSLCRYFMGVYDVDDLMLSVVHYTSFSMQPIINNVQFNSNSVKLFIENSNDVTIENVTFIGSECQNSLTIVSRGYYKSNIVMKNIQSNNCVLINLDTKLRYSFMLNNLVNSTILHKTTSYIHFLSYYPFVRDFYSSVYLEPNQSIYMMLNTFKNLSYLVNVSTSFDYEILFSIIESDTKCLNSINVEPVIIYTNNSFVLFDEYSVKANSFYGYLNITNSCHRDKFVLIGVHSVKPIKESSNAMQFIDSDKLNFTSEFVYKNKEFNNTNFNVFNTTLINFNIFDSDPYTLKNYISSNKLSLNKIVLKGKMQIKVLSYIEIVDSKFKPQSSIELQTDVINIIYSIFNGTQMTTSSNSILASNNQFLGSSIQLGSQSLNISKNSFIKCTSTNSFFMINSESSKIDLESVFHSNYFESTNYNSYYPNGLISCSVTSNYGILFSNNVLYKANLRSFISNLKGVNVIIKISENNITNSNFDKFISTDFYSHNILYPIFQIEFNNFTGNFFYNEIHIFQAEYQIRGNHLAGNRFYKNFFKITPNQNQNSYFQNNKFINNIGNNLILFEEFNTLTKIENNTFDNQVQLEIIGYSYDIDFDRVFDLSKNSWGLRSEEQLEKLFHFENIIYGLSYYVKLTPIISISTNPVENSRRKNLTISNCELVYGVIRDGVKKRLTKNNSYIIPSNLIIEKEASLIIEPGVFIYLLKNVKIYAYGELIMNGTKNEIIFVNYELDKCDYDKIIIKNSASYTGIHLLNKITPSVIRYVQISTDIRVISDGYFPVFENVQYKEIKFGYYYYYFNYPIQDNLIIFKPFNKIKLESLSTESIDTRFSVLIDEPSSFMHVNSSTINDLVKIGKLNGQLYKTLKVESIVWNHEYLLELNNEINLLLNIDCRSHAYQNLNFTIKTQANSSIKLTAFNDNNDKSLQIFEFGNLHEIEMFHNSYTFDSFISQTNHILIKMNCVLPYTVIIHIRAKSIPRYFTKSNSTILKIKESPLQYETILLNTSQNVCGFQARFTRQNMRLASFKTFYINNIGNSSLLKEISCYKCSPFTVYDTLSFQKDSTFKLIFLFNETFLNNSAFLSDFSLLECDSKDNDANITIENTKIGRFSFIDNDFKTYRANMMFKNILKEPKYKYTNTFINIQTLNYINLWLQNSLIMKYDWYNFIDIFYSNDWAQNSFTATDFHYLTPYDQVVSINSNFFYQNNFQYFFKITKDYGLRIEMKQNNYVENNFGVNFLDTYDFNGYYSHKDKSDSSLIDIVDNFFLRNIGMKFHMNLFQARNSVYIIRNGFLSNQNFELSFRCSNCSLYIEENGIVSNQVYNSYLVNAQTQSIQNYSKYLNWWGGLSLANVKSLVNGINIDEVLNNMPQSLRKLGFNNFHCERSLVEMGSNCYLDLKVRLNYSDAMSFCSLFNASVTRVSPVIADLFTPSDEFWLRKLSSNDDGYSCRSMNALDKSANQNTRCSQLNQVICQTEKSCHNLECNLNHAICSGVQCLCLDGWHGRSCNEFNCDKLNNCFGEAHGTCVGPNTCVCKANWIGRACSSNKCFAYNYCSSCTQQSGCGWCDQTKQCLPVGENNTVFDEFTCASWFYYNCFTTHDSSSCSSSILKRNNCYDTFCNKSSSDYNKMDCLKCLDNDKCYSKDLNCRSWNESSCKFGRVKSNYDDPNRNQYAKINSNLVNLDTVSDEIIYKCPFIKENPFDKTELLLTRIGSFINTLKLNSIIFSNQSEGIFHKLKTIKNVYGHLFLFGHAVGLDELYEYADFKLPTQKILDQDNSLDELQPEISSRLIDQLRNSSNRTFDLNAYQTFILYGQNYEIIQNTSVTKGIKLTILLENKSELSSIKTDDIIYSLGNINYLEVVNSVEAQNNEKYFVRTNLTSSVDIGKLSTQSFKNLINLSELACVGGTKMKNSLYVVDKRNFDNISQNDVVIGREGNKYSLLVDKVQVINGFIKIEGRQIKSINLNNEFTFHEVILERLDGFKRSSTEISYKSFKLELDNFKSYTIVDPDIDVLFALSGFSITLRLSINFEIQLSLKGSISRSFSDEASIRFFIVIFGVPIPCEFGLTFINEISISGTVAVDGSFQLKNNLVFEKTFGQDINEKTESKQNNFAIGESIRSYASSFEEFSIETKTSLGVKLSIPSYRLFKKETKKLPGFISEHWKFEDNLFSMSFYANVPLGLTLTFSPCYEKCPETKPFGIEAKVSLGFEFGFTIQSFDLEITPAKKDFEFAEKKHSCYVLDNPPETCPCKCDDGSEGKRDKDGKCDCSCICEDGSKDKIDKTGKCPCKCMCKNCVESVKKSSGCHCPDDDKKDCKWIDCKLECEEKYPCGNPPFCVLQRTGSKCDQPRCSRGCFNGVCIKTGICGSFCSCFEGWIGEACDRRVTRFFGDPWLTTFNNLTYGFQGVGEFWYCMDQINDFGIQIRTYLIAGLNTSVSSISGVAIKLSSGIFTVFINNSSDLTLRLNGNKIKNENFKIIFNDSYIKEEVIHGDFKKNVLTIDRKEHSTITIYLYKRFIDLSISLYKIFNTKGLCGASDKLYDEFRGPDNSSYSNSWDFGNSWKIKHKISTNLSLWSWSQSNFHTDDLMDERYDESFFIYDDTYHTSFRTIEIAQLKLPKNLKRSVADACEINGLTGDLLLICQLDLLATGDETFVNTESLKTGLCLNNCNGRGRCVSENLCNCSEGWSGMDCSVSECPEDCSPNGICSGGFCICNDGWDGSNCKTKSDCSLISNCTDSNQGTCVRNNKCKCNPGYGGEDCSHISLCLPLDKCSGHGVCANEECTCDSGWKSMNCAVPNCENQNYCSGNGICIGYDLCKCSEYFEGESCSIPVCSLVNNCSGNGTCVSPNKCECNPGYSGINCSMEIKCPNLNNCNGNGMCVKNLTECSCFFGYSGQYCEIINCDQVNNCSLNGKCIEPNLCECNLGYTGKFCNQTSCETLNFCSSNGECVDNKCICFDGWLENDCGIPDCSQVMNCSNNGQCIKPNTCECNKFFDGISCNITIGENLYSPLFGYELYEFQVDELKPLNSYVGKINAIDIDSDTRNSLVNYIIESYYDFDYFSIDKNGSIYLVKSLLFTEKSQLSINVTAIDNGNPRRSTTCRILFSIERYLNCDIFINPEHFFISIDYLDSSKSFTLKPTKYKDRNITYTLDPRLKQLINGIELDQNSGSLIVRLSDKIKIGKYDLNVNVKHSLNGINCEKNYPIQLRILSIPNDISTSTSTLETTREPLIVSSQPILQQQLLQQIL